MSVLLCFFTMAGLFSLSKEARAQMPLYDEAGRTYQQRVWQFDFQTTYYQATANYTSEGGQFNTLAPGFSYHLLDFDFGARWVPTRNWGLYASTRVSNAESQDLSTTRRNSSFTQAVVGTDFRLYSSRHFELFPDLSFTIPFARVDALSDEVLNREGAMEATARMIARARWGKFDPFAFAGFTYRDEDRSSLLPYGAGAELQFSDWSIGGEIRGYQTVVKDKYTNNRIQREIVAAKNGGALRYYAVDPSLLETNFWYRGQFFENWSLKLGGGTSITGAATSAGWNVIAGLSYFFEPSGNSVSRPYHSVEETTEFKEETNDGVDQNLFYIKNPNTPPPKPNPEQQKQKLQKELDKTEFQIELKKPKKKKKH